MVHKRTSTRDLHQTKSNTDDPHHAGGEARGEALLTFASGRLCWRPHGLYETQQVTNERILRKETEQKLL